GPARHLPVAAAQGKQTAAPLRQAAGLTIPPFTTKALAELVDRIAYFFVGCVTPRRLFGVNQIPVHFKVGHSTVGRNQAEAVNTILKVIQEFVRHTDGPRRIVSNSAVFNRNFHYSTSVVFS